MCIWMARVSGATCDRDGSASPLAWDLSSVTLDLPASTLVAGRQFDRSLERMSQILFGLSLVEVVVWDGRGGGRLFHLYVCHVAEQQATERAGQLLDLVIARERHVVAAAAVGLEAGC